MSRKYLAIFYFTVLYMFWKKTDGHYDTISSSSRDILGSNCKVALQQFSDHGYYRGEGQIGGYLES